MGVQHTQHMMRIQIANYPVSPPPTANGHSTAVLPRCRSGTQNQPALLLVDNAPFQFMLMTECTKILLAVDRP